MREITRAVRSLRLPKSPIMPHCCGPFVVKRTVPWMEAVLSVVRWMMRSSVYLRNPRGVAASSSLRFSLRKRLGCRRNYPICDSAVFREFALQGRSRTLTTPTLFSPAVTTSLSNWSLIGLFSMPISAVVSPTPWNSLFKKVGTVLCF